LYLLVLINCERSTTTHFIAVVKILYMMAPRNPKPKPKPFIDWRKSAAKLIILSNLEEGIIPVDDNQLSAEDAWEGCYKHIVAFRNVPFKQFNDRLKDHRRQQEQKVSAAAEEEIALAHDRRLHPRKTHNRRGEPVFDMSAAKPLLRQDVKDKTHLTMETDAFQQSSREYHGFHPKKLCERICQEVRRLQKFLFYLEMKHINEKAKIAIGYGDDAFVE
jgi:hypothetical protein